MKIPDAYFDGGMGQRQVKAQPAVMPEGGGAQAIGNAGMQLGASIAGVGFQQLEEQGRQELTAAHEYKAETERIIREQDVELKQLAKQREHSAAKTEYFNFESTLSSLHQNIVDDPDVSPEDYPAEFRKRATEAMAPLRQKLNENQWLTIGPDVQQRVNVGAEGMFKAGQQEINDNAWADDIKSAEALMNDPTKSARQKIQIISDENFFADTGRPAHEIESTRQKYVDKAIENEVVTVLTNTKGDIAALKRFAATLRARVGGKEVPGMVEPGNIDLDNRPVVKNADGSVSTVRTISVNFDGHEVLLPTVSDDGKIWTENQAVKNYLKTGKHLGIFSTSEAATQYAQQLHQDQERQYVNGENPAKIGQYSYMPEMDMKTRERYIDLAQSAVKNAEAEAKRQQAEANRQRTETARTAHDIYKTAKEGLQPLSPREENNLLAQMQGTPYYDSAKRIQKQTTSIGFVLDKVKQDPLTAGAAQLGLAIPPLDPRTAAAWPQQLAQRGQVATAIKQKYGLSFLPILTNQEAKGLVDMMGAQSPRGIVQTVQGLAKIPGMQGESMNRISQQLASADPGIGMVVGLAANGRDDAAFHVANGLQIIKGKAELKGKGSISADLDDRFMSNLKDAVSDNPRMREALQSATRAAYVSLAAAKGKDDTSMDKDVFDQAFRSVVGDVAKINGKRVVLPSGVGEGTFKDFFKNVSGDTVKAGGGVRGFQTPDEAAKAIRKSGQLYESGAGRYRVSIGGRFLQNDQGQDFLLSLGSHY